jgi:hypothetical protein
VIYETIVSTLDASGRPNFAPMGIGLREEQVLLRPFRTAVTWRNLREVGEGVVNFTDDVLWFARCALASEVPPHRPAAAVRGVVLEDVCHWKEFVVESSDLARERAEFRARVVSEGRRRDFLGFNRARHAVVEATILATRLHLLGREAVLAEITRLRPLVDKTGGPREHEAFAFVTTAAQTWTPSAASLAPGAAAVVGAPAPRGASS